MSREGEPEKQQPLWPAQMFRNTPGDNGQPIWRPEVHAAESHVLTLADALVTWMRKTEWKPGEAAKIVDFFAHTGVNPSALLGRDSGYEIAPPIMYTLDRLDPDANRLFMELLRAAWDRRMWRKHYGEIEEGTRL